jgi:hypothetical protein
MLRVINQCLTQYDSSSEPGIHKKAGKQHDTHLPIHKSGSNSRNMGQPLPLPQRILNPYESQRLTMHQMGIDIILDEPIAKPDGSVTTPSNKYVRYTLPEGWRMVDATSGRADLPCFHIIDQECAIRVTIDGVWKGGYDNDLRLHIPTELEKYEAPAEDLIPASETDLANLAGQFVQAADPQHRPYRKTEFVRRTRDYVPSDTKASDDSSENEEHSAEAEVEETRH